MNDPARAGTDLDGATWYLYLLRCRDGSLYTGVSTDVERRFQEHCRSAAGSRGAKSLRGRQPQAIVFQQAFGDRSTAQKMEYRVKRLSKQRKEDLVARRLNLAELEEEGELTGEQNRVPESEGS